MLNFILSILLVVVFSFCDAPQLYQIIKEDPVLFFVFFLLFLLILQCLKVTNFKTFLKKEIMHMQIFLKEFLKELLKILKNYFMNMQIFLKELLKKTELVWVKLKTSVTVDLTLILIKLILILFTFFVFAYSYKHHQHILIQELMLENEKVLRMLQASNSELEDLKITILKWFGKFVTNRRVLGVYIFVFLEGLIMHITGWPSAFEDIIFKTLYTKDPTILLFVVALVVGAVILILVTRWLSLNARVNCQINKFIGFLLTTYSCTFLNRVCFSVIIILILGIFYVGFDIIINVETLEGLQYKNNILHDNLNSVKTQLNTLQIQFAALQAKWEAYIS